MDEREIDAFYKSLSADDEEVNDALAFVEHLRKQEERNRSPAEGAVTADAANEPGEEPLPDGTVSLAAIAEHYVPKKKKRRRPLEALIP